MTSVVDIAQHRTELQFRRNVERHLAETCKRYPDVQEHLVGKAYVPKVERFEKGAGIVFSVPNLVVTDIRETLDRIQQGLNNLLIKLDLPITSVGPGSGVDEQGRQVDRFVFNVPLEQAEKAERVVRQLEALIERSAVERSGKKSPDRR